MKPMRPLFTLTLIPLHIKKLPSISTEDVKNAFNRNDLQVYTDSTLLINYLKDTNWEYKNLLMMSSGNFDGININDLAMQLI